MIGTQPDQKPTTSGENMNRAVDDPISKLLAAMQLATSFISTLPTSTVPVEVSLFCQPGSRDIWRLAIWLDEAGGQESFSKVLTVGT